jgi:acyl dehydratase
MRSSVTLSLSCLLAFAAALSAPVPAKRVVGGGSEYRIHRLVRPGDVITVRSRTKDIQTKQGRSGLLYLIVVETAFTDAQDLPVATEIATYINRV